MFLILACQGYGPLNEADRLMLKTAVNMSYVNQRPCL